MANTIGNEVDLMSPGRGHTFQEIIGQPELWSATWKSVRGKKSEIVEFLSELKHFSNLQAILTGAGTSAFIGEVLEGPFQRYTGMFTKAVATTDLVTHPELVFGHDRDTLLVSFARSGNSPESAKAVELAGHLSRNVFHLVITCNTDSALLKAVEGTDSLVLLLPPEANDKSLAMTGSFTAMLLSGLLISDIRDIDRNEFAVAIMREYGRKIFKDYFAALRHVAELDFDRAVFLGSGPMKGTARESHLKLQELTDGKVICKFDSFLGFRHGPKAVVNERTILGYLFTNNDYASRYEVDLVKGIAGGRKPLYSIGITEERLDGIDVDLLILLGDGKSKLSEEFLAIVSVLPAQLLGFLKSIQLGLKPDNPSESGMIHRVVQGVKIYPYEDVR